MLIRCLVEDPESKGRKANLLGVQPALFASDYASKRALRKKLRGYLQEAQALGLILEATIVVFPELIGAWSMLSDQTRLAVGARRLSHAAVLLAASSPRRLLYSAWAGRAGFKDAFFRMNAAKNAAIYQEVFSTLAAEFGVTIVAGSTILPGAVVRFGRVESGEGPLQNVGAVFGPDGRAHDQLVRKVHPIAEEATFVSPGRLDALPVFDTPAGRLGVLICADSWYPACYRRLKEEGATVLAVPAFLPGDGTWSRIWPGYSGAPPPAGVDPGDPQRLTEGAAWLKYAMGGRLGDSGLLRGMTVFARGSLFDLGSDGGSFAVAGEDRMSVPESGGEALLNLRWQP